MGRRSIARHRDFRRVFATGNRARRDGVTVWVAGSDRAEKSRLGLAVRREVGSAVVRNRVKRRLRAAFAEAGVPPGYDVIARADRELAGKNFQEVRAHLVGALAAAGLEVAHR